MDKGYRVGTSSFEHFKRNTKKAKKTTQNKKFKIRLNYHG
jgi:hypothetical protein